MNPIPPEFAHPAPSQPPEWLLRLQALQQLQTRTQPTVQQLWAYLSEWSDESLHSLFLAVSPHLSDPEYWRLLRRVWSKVVTGRPTAAEWLRLFSRNRGHRHHLMTMPERRLLARLPSTVTVYDTGPRTDGLPSLTWMLTRDAARLRSACSARLRDHSPKTVPVLKEPLKVAVGTCSRKSILAVLSRHGECSIIVDPDSVRLKPEHLWLRVR